MQGLRDFLVGHFWRRLAASDVGVLEFFELLVDPHFGFKRLYGWRDDDLLAQKFPVDLRLIWSICLLIFCNHWLADGNNFLRQVRGSFLDLRFYEVHFIKLNLVFGSYAALVLGLVGFLLELHQVKSSLSVQGLSFVP